MAKLYGKVLWQNSMAAPCSKLCARLHAKLYAIAKLYAMTKLYAVLSSGKTLFSKTLCNKFYAMTKLYAARLHATLCNFMQTLRQNSMQLHATLCNFMQTLQKTLARFKSATNNNRATSNNERKQWPFSGPNLNSLHSNQK